jgi:hypothetical protein
VSKEAPAGDALTLGGPRREPAAYIGLGLLVLVATIMTCVLWGFAGQGPWPVPIVWGVTAIMAMRLLATREVRIASDGILLTRHLLGRSRTRRMATDGVTTARVQGECVASRHQRSDGTPEGDAQLLMFTVTLRGSPRLTLGFSRDVEAMERLALEAARLLGVPATRRGYARRWDGLPQRRPKHVETLI